MGENARHLVEEKFNLERELDAYTRVYEEIHI
jgi:hypothetical protein